ncbi:CHAP domain-containing protein [Streptococcus iniae]|uniref:CHAP domain-containing protein n=1 Tax=Streptococcus iniae TaxID=1346 RepID=UPI000EF71ADD|nr:CHAP domain-containing protein [Streptococcus iniae]RLV16410.1 CHAP domain-containing protein [Streptococcus iniae]
MKKDKYIALLMLSALLLPSFNAVSVVANETSTATNQEAVTSITDLEKDSAKESAVSEAKEVTPVVEQEVPLPQEPAKDGTSTDATKPGEVTEPSKPVEPSIPKPDQGQKDPEKPGDTTSPVQPPVVSVPTTPVVPATPAVSEAPTTAPIQAPVLPITAPISKFTAMESRPSASAFAAYVDHWTDSDAYTHNLLSRRYGIKAEQLDGFLQSTGIAYDSKRINGQKLLDWEKESGLDVRAIVAIALAESSLGTQGVAKTPGANMFGYAAFDHSPQSAQQFSDDIAIIKLTQATIVQNHNSSFAIQDKKAQLLSDGLLNTSVDGGVYFTDASGTGKRRAEVMEKLDQWIDRHGGTPEIPAELRVQASASLASVPVGYKLSKLNRVIDYISSTYAWGQCTWYVYNRGQELGYQFDAYMGNGGDWKMKPGYGVTHKAEVGYAVSFSPGQAGADPTYGHVAIVEEVKKDGSILISESNALGLGVVSYRTFTAAEAAQLTYVVGHK